MCICVMQDKTHVQLYNIATFEMNTEKNQIIWKGFKKYFH